MIFNDDTVLQSMVETFIAKHNIELIVETGTWRGYTTEFFAKTNLPVIGTEIYQESYDIAKQRLEPYKNVQLLLGDSTNNLTQTLPKDNKRVFFYLDSHGFHDRSLDRELELIAKLENITPFIAIHDFQVPNTTLRYDINDNQVYSYSTFENAFKKIYNRFDGFNFFYNDNTSVGQRVGCIFLEPKNYTNQK